MIEKNQITSKEKNVKDHDSFAIFMVCGGYFFYTVMETILKYLVTELPIAQITTTMNAVSLALLFGLIWKKYGFKGFKFPRSKLYILYLLFFIPAPFLDMKSLEILPLTEYYPIIFMTPLLLVFASFFILKEPLELMKIVMILIGLLGVFIVIQGNFTEQWLGALYAMLLVMCLVGEALCLRKMKHRPSAIKIAFYPSLIVMLVYMPFAVSGFQPPTHFQWGLLIACGVAVFLGRIGVIIGYTYATKTDIVASYNYTQIIWGILFGYLVFEHIPSASTLIGATLIIYAGLYTTLFTIRKKRQVWPLQ